LTVATAAAFGSDLEQRECGAFAASREARVVATRSALAAWLMVADGTAHYAPHCGKPRTPL
jgi:hypothetical protein